jgi:hypothetical protein
MKGIRNTCVPVNKLPPEVLSRALEYRTSERDLIAATQVCQHWRSALVSTPSLWNCFQFRSSPDHDRTLVYLERSKSAPIDIQIITTELPDLEVFRYLAPNIARTRSLYIRAGHDIRHTLLHLCDPAPSLQRLEIHALGGVLSLPDNFLAQQAPSLHSINLTFTRPAFDHFFPLPNLTEFNMCIPWGAEPFRLGALLQFFSGSPLLHRICIRISSQTIQDISPNQTTSLDSLVEMDYSCKPTNSILPFLRLPRLKRLRVASTVRPGQTQKLADMLPCGSHALLARTIMISLHSDRCAYSDRIDLFGDGIDASFSAFCNTVHVPTDRLVDWFSDQTAIPFGQVQELRIGGSPVPGFPIDVFALENLRILRVALQDAQFAEEFLRLFHPEPCAGVPCRSLREIEYAYRGTEGSLPRSLTKSGQGEGAGWLSAGAFLLVGRTRIRSGSFGGAEGVCRRGSS